MKKIVGIACFLLFYSVPTFAAESARTPVFFQSTGSDPAGERLAYAIRERFRSSNGLRLALLQEDAFYRVYLVTLEPTSAQGMTVYSIVWTYKGADDVDVLQSQNVGICGASIVDRCAESIVAATDKLVGEGAAAFAKAFRDVLQKPSAEPPAQQ